MTTTARPSRSGSKDRRNRRLGVSVPLRLAILRFVVTQHDPGA